MKIMERKHIIIASLLMWGAITAEAQTIKVNNATASGNGSLELKVVAGADINKYIATGFLVELPEGFSVAGVETVKGEDMQSDHAVRVGQIGTTKLRVAVYSLSNSAFNLYSIPETAGPGQSGGGGGGGRTARQKTPTEEEEDIPLTLCTLKLKAPNTIGSFEGKLSKIEFATNSHALETTDVSSFIITIQGKGDVNGDGTINVKDVVDLVSYLSGKKSLDVNAADVNGDGVVNVADAIQIANAIMTFK